LGSETTTPHPADAGSREAEPYMYMKSAERRREFELIRMLY